MKNINNSKRKLIIVASFLFLVSCSDALNTVPITDEIMGAQDSDALLIKNAVEAEQDMKAVNAIFADEFWQFDYFVAGDAGSDVAYAGADQDTFFQIDEYRMVSTNYVAERDWKHMVEDVNKCNLIINYVNTVPDLDQARKEEMMGEASLFRALCRFTAVQMWGDYPIVNTTVTSVNNANFDVVYPSLYPARKPISDVYASIIADCEVALAKAPTSNSAPASKFRASKGAANAMLAKVYATMPNPDWSKCKQYCDAVIAGGYTLMPTYNHLFDNAHEGNAESIWEVNGGGAGSPINAWCTDVFQGQNWKKFNTPSHAIYDAFKNNGEIATGPSPANPVKRGDVSILKKPTTFADPYWALLSKFPYPNKMRKSDGTQNFYLFRLADILLLKAEALAHTGDLSGALTLVNQVRARVTLPALTAFTDSNDAINKILKERFTELCFEGQRWFDLKREGKALEILAQQTYTPLSGIATPLPYVGNLSQNDLLWPIPQSILDNNPNLTQNPGY